LRVTSRQLLGRDGAGSRAVDTRPRACCKHHISLVSGRSAPHWID
jgi:hypothetical protein